MSTASGLILIELIESRRGFVGKSCVINDAGRMAALHAYALHTRSAIHHSQGGSREIETSGLTNFLNYKNTRTTPKFYYFLYT